ncbi:serine hydrolase domain-containing protein [Rhodococcus sp. 14-2483-1-2]|uniref:serine hydrolase domain-containing protein n=1 Tax=Rhodococcus sp. 14-2483-1-2 TaxID=2023147 RepID=UPI000B9C0D71|nr:serine hydrolase domain-containing protein [Rhodococcus sp. 14-2483-1-2]OZF26069.1 hypothetical protein CH295_25910 [Rhodococcus sp. 14-2483-1-2]
MELEQLSVKLPAATGGDLEWISTHIDGAPVRGWYDPAFKQTRDAFLALYDNGAEEPEVGSTVGVVIGGRTVVELVGGWQDPGRTRQWEFATAVNQMSVTKGIAAICIHVLVDRGLLDLDQPVAAYWPEFAAEGKHDVLVRHVLDMTAGLPGAVGASPGDIYSHERMVAVLAAIPTSWPPGTRAGYHVLTQGYLLNELVRRTDGRTMGRFLEEEIAGPLGADFHLGIPLSEARRTAQWLLPDGVFPRVSDIPPGFFADSWSGSTDDTAFQNTVGWRTGECPSGNGHGTALGTAAIYSAFASARLTTAATRDRAITEQHNLVEEVLGRRYHQALGFLLDSLPTVTYGGSATAFGHHGIGGSLGFGDTEGEIGFGYAMNRVHTRPENGPRAGSLVAALRRDLA